MLQFIQKRLHVSGGRIQVVQSKHHGFPCHFGFVPVLQIGTCTKSQQDTYQGTHGTPDRVLPKILIKKLFHCLTVCLFDYDLEFQIGARRIVCLPIAFPRLAATQYVVVGTRGVVVSGISRQVHATFGVAFGIHDFELCLD